MTAADRPSVPRVGDTLTTAEQLDTLPSLTVVMDANGEVQQRHGHLTTQDGDYSAWLGVMPPTCKPSREVALPATVLYVPGEQPCRHCGSCDGPPSCPDCDHADRPSVTDDTRAEAAAALRSTVDLDPRSDFDRGYAHGWHAAAEWAAGRPSVTDNARAAAEQRYPALNSDDEELTYPRSAVREHARGGFVAGYEAGWAAGRAETTTAHECDSGDFDRTICDCGAMHSYCTSCGTRQDDCPHGTTTTTPPGLTVSEDGSVLNWQGVNYVPQRAETATATIEDAARLLQRYAAREAVIIFDGAAQEIAQELHAHGLLATGHTRPTRDDLARAIASGYEPDHPTPNRHDYRAADAVLALLRGGA